MVIGNQKVFLTLHVKNEVKGKATETHLGDSRDLTALIQDLKHISQNSNI